MKHKLYESIAMGAALMLGTVFGIASATDPINGPGPGNAADSSSAPAQSSPSGAPASSSSPAPAASLTGSVTAAAGMGDLDQNKDGAVSKNEAKKNKALFKQWSKLDVNKDGKLDQGEFAAFESGGASSGSTPAPKYTK